MGLSMKYLTFLNEHCCYLWLLLLICNRSQAVQVSSDTKTVSISPQTYVSPELWSGLLWLQNTYEVDANTRKSLELLLLDKRLRTCCITAADSPQLPLLSELFAASQQHAQLDTTEIFRASGGLSINALATCEVIWLEVDEATSQAIAALTAKDREQFVDTLRTVLAKSGVVCIAGKLDWIATHVASREEHRYAGLLQNCIVNGADKTSEAATVHAAIPTGGRLAISQRQAICMSNTPVEFTLAATEHYPEPLVYRLKSGEVLDWTQLQRTLHERQQEFFPAATIYDHRLSAGALVIGGGGGMPTEVWERFVELAGGMHSRIVILPTAVPEPSATPGLEHRLLTKAGADTITILPQVSREEVSSPEFLRELDQATGVWFGGGRQWHFVDAYWGTPAWEKLQAVCQRGGVIGGSSAGATIQGGVLVRGAPVGNHIMLADGYRHGLGLLPGVAIDQHFAQRNRFKDLESCLASFPSVYGLGIDEQTALIVTAPNQCEVLGNGSVWCYPSKPPDDNTHEDTTRSASRIEYKPGSSFSLDTQ